MQLTLEGYPVGYTCHKCGKSFDNMSAVVRHAKRIHKKKPQTITHLNLILENWQMISQKILVIQN